DELAPWCGRGEVAAHVVGHRRGVLVADGGGAVGARLAGDQAFGAHDVADQVEPGGGDLRVVAAGEDRVHAAGAVGAAAELERGAHVVGDLRATQLTVGGDGGAPVVVARARDLHRRAHADHGQLLDG